MNPDAAMFTASFLRPGFVGETRNERALHSTFATRTPVRDYATTKNSGEHRRGSTAWIVSRLHFVIAAVSPSLPSHETPILGIALTMISPEECI